MEAIQNPYFSKNCSIPCTSRTLLDNGGNITNSYDIVNTFNNYFASMAGTTKKSIKYSHKHFSDYLSNEARSTIFLQPIDKEEIANIVSSPNSSKVSGLNSIPYRILFLLKNEILKKLTVVFLQPLFHEWYFFFCTQSCKTSVCFYKRFKIRL